MKRIAIVYFSQDGATRLLAQHVAEGAQHQGVESITLEIKAADIVTGRYQNDALFRRLQTCDAIVFASPTYMGGPAAQFKAFMDTSSDGYANKLWRNKLAGGLTMGGSVNGEQQQTLYSFVTLACQHGMIWVGLDVSKHTDSRGLNHTGSSIGVVASYLDNTSQVNSNDLATAFYYGERMASLLNK